MLRQKRLVLTKAALDELRSGKPRTTATARRKDGNVTEDKEPTSQRTAPHTWAEAGTAPDHSAAADHRKGHAPVGSTATAYPFEVNPWATKDEIKAAAEELFGVRVEKVRTQNRAGQEAPLPLPHGPTAATGRRPSSRCIRTARRSSSSKIRQSGIVRIERHRRVGSTSTGS